ncbi:SpaA isopeptide-forming pilin-related protein [Levilactobacillus spicheri]|uniref:Gram-positive cocci surface proteins LPxTG domain-containing protein n=2 Tax=Levilactobacillus spicheri TaxID=216463 RepID=A0ABQ0WMS0_9LACO|nr:SpaA isopeptide-forming pilin-related protein [Levilactobacillus spicheri]KRL46382.1 outer membrane protein [Levilactobacillus spicheri DSM 15429]GEO66266.1 hypothetical protein LSP04_06850 [Levilactobacillus spicheri]
MRKKIGRCLLGVLILVVGICGAYRMAQAKDIGNDVQGLSASDATVTRSDGLVVKDGDVLEKGQQYTVAYKWKIADGVSVENGDTATFELPSSAWIHGAYSNPLWLTTDNQQKIVVGRVELAENAHQGTITFNENMQGYNTNRDASLQFFVTGTGQSTSGDGSGGTGTGTDSGSGTVTNENFDINKVGWEADSSMIGSGSSAESAPTTMYWNIVINGHNENYGDTTVTDDLGPYQTYIPGSFALDGNSAGAGGTVTQQGSELTFKFTNVTKKIGFTFQVKIDTPTGFGKLYNDAVLKTDNAFPDQTDSQHALITSKTVHASRGWGMDPVIGGTYYGAVSFFKFQTGTTLGLADAFYNLFDQETGKLLLTRKTNGDGYITVSGLQAGKYYFKESSAPSGYDVNSSEVSFTVDRSNQNSVVSVSQNDDILSESSTSSEPDTSSEPIISSDSDTSSEPSEPNTSGTSSTPSTSSDSSFSNDSSTPSEPSVSSISSSFSASSTPMISSNPSLSSNSDSSVGSNQSQVTVLVPSSSTGSTGSSSRPVTDNGANGGATGIAQVTPSSVTKKTKVVPPTKNQGKMTAVVKINRPQTSGTARDISRLPQTSEQQRVSAFVLGILVLGGALSYQAWRRRD